jgi:hypothetical protein
MSEEEKLADVPSADFHQVAGDINVGDTTTFSVSPDGPNGSGVTYVQADDIVSHPDAPFELNTDYNTKPTSKDWLAAVRDVVDAGKEVAPEISKNLSQHLDSYETLIEILDRSPEEVTKMMGLLSSLTGTQPVQAMPVPQQPVPTPQVQVDGRLVTCEQMQAPHPVTTCQVQGNHTGTVVLPPDLDVSGPPQTAPVDPLLQQMSANNSAASGGMPNGVPPMGPPVGLGGGGQVSPSVSNWLASSGMDGSPQNFSSERTRAAGPRRVASYGEKQPGGGSPQQLTRQVE